jgi:CheY-like chemotaxis protein
VLVLVVEDDSQIRSLAVQVLTAQGHRVSSARDGAEALASLEQAWPDLLLVDLMMPNMDGRAVIERFRALPRGLATSIVVMSAEPASQHVGLDVDDWLSKPFDIDALIAAVQRAGKGDSGRHVEDVRAVPSSKRQTTS